MSRKLRVEVTADDLAEGQPGNTTTCPAARAARRALFPENYVTVGIDYQTGRWTLTVNEVLRRCGTVVTLSRVRQTALLPLAAVRKIEAFDDGKPVKPFAFTVTLPD